MRTLARKLAKLLWKWSDALKAWSDRDQKVGPFWVGWDARLQHLIIDGAPFSREQIDAMTHHRRQWPNGVNPADPSNS